MITSTIRELSQPGHYVATPACSLCGEPTDGVPDSREALFWCAHCRRMMQLNPFQGILARAALALFRRLGLVRPRRVVHRAAVPAREPTGWY